jgi:rare lipoprotein A (peptidoglycan hydrolase)
MRARSLIAALSAFSLFAYTAIASARSLVTRDELEHCDRHFGQSKSNCDHQHNNRAYSELRTFTGVASYYWEGKQVATGARFDPDGLTAAHRTLPLGTRLRVTNLASSRSVVVTVNDRGPFIAGRVLDLSRGAAKVLGMIERGIARIEASVL